MNRFTRSIFLTFALVLFVSGCATRTTTTETRTVDHPATTAEPAYDDDVVVERRTVTTTEADEGCGGVLSCTVSVVGEVIALPFRAVGALVDAVF